jgi:hypothetical protein
MLAGHGLFFRMVACEHHDVTKGGAWTHCVQWQEECNNAGCMLQLHHSKFQQAILHSQASTTSIVDPHIRLYDDKCMYLYKLKSNSVVGICAGDPSGAPPKRTHMAGSSWGIQRLKGQRHSMASASTIPRLYMSDCAQILPS